MPSQRKRIGFLPREEVQNIIDQICIHHKLSQSKVTGILVEEALISRGILKSSENYKYYEFDCKYYESALNDNEVTNNKINNENININLDETNIDDKIQMINEFIEFKLFKNIMIKNKNKKINF